MNQAADKRNGEWTGRSNKPEGHEVIEGMDGMDGLEKIIANPDTDLILLDIRMPHFGGYETIKEIKEVTDAPVIFLTALGGL